MSLGQPEQPGSRGRPQRNPRPERPLLTLGTSWTPVQGESPKAGQTGEAGSGCVAEAGVGRGHQKSPWVLTQPPHTHTCLSACSPISDPSPSPSLLSLAAVGPRSEPPLHLRLSCTQGSPACVHCLVRLFLGHPSDPQLSYRTAPGKASCTFSRAPLPFHSAHRPGHTQISRRACQQPHVLTDPPTPLCDHF